MSDDLKARLRAEAEMEARCDKVLADAKSARQADKDDYPDFPLHGYGSIAPEQTTRWKAADRIEKLEAENAELNIECERAWEAYRIAFGRAMSNGEALQGLRATLSGNSAVTK